ncbi:UDP-glucose--hexose-1-phosphate uridylyltransferase [Bacillus cereus]|uniref:UDP-glucose--hexose-1-phosphate uridylyltransferase n=1 Tax=Bacillus nitratireducens TaxID=2026193 RepID=UPI000BF41F47|nr:UDP-glucose--hexose-1-phosphate uridylyltransferase [Bacillus nitratireducens]PFB92934.1 UDP-glucose--hexose-1-phosphate uridylyltransferase [Bacillus cereus]PFI37818.1 UDP-glucose--hexose-1-phosphate uridylyltransferase [Bacillus cereus]PGU32278.1 UDP-glucose--hexose-1-phosphate uridylyltransferase [Bacillus cereus]
MMNGVETMNTCQAIYDFITLAIENGTIEENDRIYMHNQLLRLLGESEMEEITSVVETDPHVLLDTLLDKARENLTISKNQANRDMFEALLMNVITPLPSKVNANFQERYRKSPEQATDYFFELSKRNDYIKTRAIAKNIHYVAKSKYGELEITINLSKPEKNPKEILAARNTPKGNYPKCLLCIENEGYFGRWNHPGRSSHRIINIELDGEEWGFQYSPYAYFNEHSIVLSKKHRPMKISREAFSRLFSFVEIMPHYFIGSNADLPIVGGSILSHDHYQAGRHNFPMAKAKVLKVFELSGYSNISCGIVNWPMSVIRLSSLNKEELINASTYIHESWKNYSDEFLQIRAQSKDGTKHHTITPIVRRSEGKYEIDLVLRDNNVSEEYPDGIFHSHPDVQHIKKENIGLIEVMGLAVLPPRLIEELHEVELYLLDKKADVLEIHQKWADELKAQGGYTEENIQSFLQTEVAKIFERVLEDAGVYKMNKDGRTGFDRFIKELQSANREMMTK